MPYVMTVDQRHSRRGADLVHEALAMLGEQVGPVLRGFERTAGDEFQGLLADPAQVVRATFALLRRGAWSVGVGLGPVDEPLPASTRAARGRAFENARTALETAKRRTHHVAVTGPDDRAHDADVLFTLLAALVSRRTDLGWQAVDMTDAGHTVTEIADHLGISRQAVGQRLAVAHHQEERDGRELAVRLLERAAS